MRVARAGSATAAILRSVSWPEGEGGINLWHLWAALPHRLSRTDFFYCARDLIIFFGIKEFKRRQPLAPTETATSSRRCARCDRTRPFGEDLFSDRRDQVERTRGRGARVSGNLPARTGGP